MRLDTVVAAFEQGATPEEIGLRYDTLDLADVYAAIAYYLRHRDEVGAYLRARKAEADPPEADAKSAKDGSIARRSATASVPEPLAFDCEDAAI